MKWLGVCVLCLLLFGCAGHWVHPTATREQVLKDDYECTIENRYAFPVMFQTKDRRMYARCMQVRGYVWSR